MHLGNVSIWRVPLYQAARAIVVAVVACVKFRSVSIKALVSEAEGMCARGWVVPFHPRCIVSLFFFGGVNK